MKKKLTLIMAVLLIASGLLAGCRNKTDTSSKAVPSASSVSAAEFIDINGLENSDIKLSLAEIKAAKVYTGVVTGENSAGKQLKFNIKGAYFSDILKKYGFSQQNLNGIRIEASDGYSIEVPHDVITARDIVLAYEEDGKPLSGGEGPIRIFIPNERAMYWVKGVTKLEITKTAVSNSVSGIYIMDSIYKPSDYQNYEYLGKTFNVLSTEKIITDYPGSGGSVVIMAAADGLVKNETKENFLKGVIDMTGGNAPEFFSSMLPAGMSVKNILYVKYGGSAFVFGAKLIKKEGTATLDSLISSCGMTKSGNYILTYSGNKKLNINADSAKSYILNYDDSKGIYSVRDGSNSQYWDIVSININ